MSRHSLPAPDSDICYQLLRSAKRRSIGFKIDQHGLTVTIPTALPLALLQPILQQRAGWIRSKLGEIADRLASLPAAPPRLRHGDSVLWLGRPLLVRRINHGLSRVTEDGVEVLASGDAELDRTLADFMQQNASRLFAQRVQHWSAIMRLFPGKLGLSNARGRWGSCNSRGGLRLNWRLLQAPLEVIDSVIVHELAHLAELNHSPRFWAIVEAHCPLYRQHDAWLKQHGQQLFHWWQ